MALDPNFVKETLDSVALRYRGPGGAAAVLQNGKLVGQRVWGYADINKQIPLTDETLMPICSITKQFVCALLLNIYHSSPGDVRQQMTDQLSELLPEIDKDSGLTIEHLCDMQSGLRDYWAMTTLWGAKPDDKFSIEDHCPPALKKTKSFHFKPGTEYSYCNVNFHVVARAIERVTGEPLGKLLAERILAPAGMKTAALCPNTAEQPPPCVGYEGDEQHGYVPALNQMEWSGDAGLVASLTDMIAWEKYLDKEYNDNQQSWYHTICQTQTFEDGSPAPYHYGMIHDDIDGVDSYGHAGALRGYRLQRSHAPKKRLSVIVMFNHESDPCRAVDDVMRAILKKPKPQNDSSIHPSPEWFGTFLDQDTQLAITVAKSSKPGEILITYADHLESSPLQLTDANNGKTQAMVASIDGDRLHIHRVQENRKLDARRLVPRDSSLKDTTPLNGQYKCEEVDSVFDCSGDAGMLYGSFKGYLGNGFRSPMRYLGDDVWAFTCARGLDAPAPGDWTVVFHRDQAGAVNGFTIGCWLARKLEFIKVL